jgi:hypothetical protein
MIQLKRWLLRNQSSASDPKLVTKIKINTFKYSHLGCCQLSPALPNLLEWFLTKNHNNKDTNRVSHERLYQYNRKHKKCKLICKRTPWREKANKNRLFISSQLIVKLLEQLDKWGAKSLQNHHLPEVVVSRAEPVIFLSPEVEPIKNNQIWIKE